MLVHNFPLSRVGSRNRVCSLNWTNYSPNTGFSSFYLFVISTMYYVCYSQNISVDFDARLLIFMPRPTDGLHAMLLHRAGGHFYLFRREIDCCAKCVP